MTKVNCVLMLVILVTISTLTIIPVYAQVSGPPRSGGGGDATPPTLENALEDTLMINDNSFAVESFKQSLDEVQPLYVNETNTVILKIQDGSGPQAVSHIELHFGLFTLLIEGVQVPQSNVHIISNGLDGYKINGEREILANVKVNNNIDEDFAVITFEFEPTQTMDVSTLWVKMWDEKKNPWTNYFYDSIQIIERNPISTDDNAKPIDVSPELEVTTENDDAGKLTTENDDAGKIPFEEIKKPLDAKTIESTRSIAIDQINQGQLDDALDIWMQLLTEYPDSFIIHNEIGIVYTLTNDHEFAKQYFQHAIVLAPDDKIFHTNYAISLLNTGNPDESVMYLDEKILNKDPNYMFALENKIVGLVGAGRSQEALPLIDEVFQKHPTSLDVLTAKCVIAYEQGSTTAANKCLDIVNQIEPFYYATLILETSSDELETANSQLSSSWAGMLPESYANPISDEPLQVNYSSESRHDDTETMIRVAEALNFLGENDNGLFLIEEVLKKDMNDIDVLLLKADILLEQGEQNEALKNYELVLELDPDNATALLSKNNMLESIGNEEFDSDGIDSIYIIMLLFAVFIAVFLSRNIVTGGEHNVTYKVYGEMK